MVEVVVDREEFITAGAILVIVISVRCGLGIVKKRSVPLISEGFVTIQSISLTARWSDDSGVVFVSGSVQGTVESLVGRSFVQSGVLFEGNFKVVMTDVSLERFLRNDVEWRGQK